MSSEELSNDRTERRKGMDELKAKVDIIVSNQQVIKTYIEKQFGGVNLAGTPVEGDITKQLRELNEKVKIQNGRIGKLEVSKVYILGGVAAVGGMLALVAYIVNLLKGG